MKRDETLRKIAQSKRNKALADSDADERVDHTIFSHYDDKQFLEYYEKKLGITSEKVNPFVTYTLTDKDYEDMLEKTRMQALKLDNAANSQSHKKIRRVKSKHVTPAKVRKNSSVVQSQSSQVRLPTLHSYDSRALSMSETKQDKEVVLGRHHELIRNIQSNHRTLNASRSGSKNERPTDYSSESYSMAAEKQEVISCKFTSNFV